MIVVVVKEINKVNLAQKKIKNLIINLITKLTNYYFQD